MLTNKYQGNTVDAVQVTEDNINEVAEWCGGEASTRTFKARNDDPAAEEVMLTKPCINVKPHRPGAWRFGSVGDWFVKDETGIVRIFPKNIFLKIFHEVDEPEKTVPMPRRAARRAAEIVDDVVETPVEIANEAFATAE